MMIHTCYIMTQVNVHNISNRLGANAQMDLQLWTNWCVEAEGLGFLPHRGEDQSKIRTESESAMLAHTARACLFSI